MTVRTVQNRLTLPGGGPRIEQPITIKLVPAAGFTDSGQDEILGISRTATDETGLWSIGLQPNAEIDPANSHYEVTEDAGTVWTFLVPAGDGPVWLRDCLLSDPQAGPVPVLGANGRGGGTAPVTSVNSQTGDVQLTAADVDADASGTADQAVTAHTGATDPHGDRAYAAAQISAAINGLINSAPSLLDTLGEIAAQLANDESVVAALTTALAARLIAANNLSDLTDPAAARTSLGLGSAALQPAEAFAPADGGSGGTPTILEAQATEESGDLLQLRDVDGNAVAFFRRASGYGYYLQLSAGSGQASLSGVDGDAQLYLSGSDGAIRAEDDATAGPILELRGMTGQTQPVFRVQEPGTRRTLLTIDAQGQLALCAPGGGMFGLAVADDGTLSTVALT